MISFLHLMLLATSWIHIMLQGMTWHGLLSCRITVFLLAILHNIHTPYINHLKLPLGEVKTLPMQICCLAFASSRRCFNILENLTNLTWAICHVRCAKFVGGFFCNTMDLFFTPWKITQFLCLLIHICESNKQMPYYIAKLDMWLCVLIFLVIHI